MAAQEYTIADFSGGINPSVQADKLVPNESLQLQNVRLDEFGGIQSCPGSTKQVSGLTDGTRTNAHSIYIAPSLGCFAGVGTDVYTGVNFADLSDTLIGQNSAQAKMSGTTTPNRVFFEVNGTPYVIGGVLTAPVPVDWAPPSQVAPTPSGPFALATAGTATVGTSNPSWTHTQGLISTASGTASCTFIPGSPGQSNYVRGNNFAPALGTTAAVQGVQFTAIVNVTCPATVGTVRYEAILEVGGAIVGTPRSVFINVNGGIGTATFGGVSDLWGLTAGSLTAAQCNASNFGVRFICINGGSKSQNVTCFIRNIQANFYQSAGTGLTVGTGTTGVLTGTYTYVVTFTSDEGEESGASSASNAGTFATQQAALSSIPIGDARTTGRNIYRIGGALTSHYLVGSLADNVTQTFADNTSDIAVLTEGVILPGDVVGTSPSTRLGTQQGKFPCFHLQRLFWSNGNSLFWSDVENNYSYPAVNQLPVGDSTPISGLIEKWGCLIIVKTGAIYILSGTDESNFTLVQTDSVVGTDQSFTLCSIPNGVLFGNSQGIYVFNGAVSTKYAPKLNLLFRNETRNGITAIEVTNKAVTANYCAAASADYFYFACAAKGTTSNNLLFVLNLTNGQITTRSIDVLSLTADNTSGFVYAGLANGQIVQLDDYTNSADSQGALSWIYQSGYTDCGARGSNLTIWSFEFYGNTGGLSVTPTISYDGGNRSETLASFSTTSNQRVQRKFSDSNSRKAQSVSIQLVSSVTGALIDMTHIKIFYEVLPGRARTGQ